jgi:hypothetical protein
VEFVLQLSKVLLLLSFLLAVTVQSTFADVPKAELIALFPDQVGGLRRVQVPTPTDALSSLTKETVAKSEYAGNGQRLLVEVVKFHQDTESYSLLSLLADDARRNDGKILLGSDYGTAAFSNAGQLVFFKGVKLVRITNIGTSGTGAREAFAKAFADTIDKGENDIPALVKHLPSPDQSQKKAIFLTRFTALQTLVPNHTVLSAVETEGNADAAFVVTESGKILIVEYNTPQLAKENDERIVTKIQDLWKQGLPAPSAYKRVGNYSVFVFDSPDEATAKNLISQVKYEQVVQWLGENPYIFKEAEKRYVETTLGVFIAVVKASGYALVGCLALGGLIGALLFSRRRAQQKNQEAFSDAGGMLRLNIDDLSSPQTDPARLLGPGN